MENISSDVKRSFGDVLNAYKNDHVDGNVAMEDWIKKNISSKPNDKKCKHGFVLKYEAHCWKWDSASIVATDARWRIANECPKCVEERQEHELVERQKLEAETRIKNIGIPNRFEGIDATEVLDGDIWESYMWNGGVGTGKTYKMVSRLVGICRTHNVRVRFSTWGNMCMEIRNAVLNGGYSDYFKMIMDRSIIVIDDLGIENTTDFIREFLYNIVNECYNQCKPIFITTNLKSNDIARVYGERTVSRLLEMCKVVKTEGKDRRIKNNNVIK